MSAFKLHTLKQKLWAIVAASLVARVLIFFSLPKTFTSIAPDEGTYASLARWVGESKAVGDFPGFSEGLYLSGRMLIVPASILYRIGINELDAVRLVSTIYGFGGLILVVAVILKLYKENTVESLSGRFNNHMIIGLVAIFAFMPSHFVWSNLGLRESATEFWLLSTFMALFFVYQFRKKIRFLTLLILLGSIVFTFSSRPQVGWVLGVTLIAYLIFNLSNLNSVFTLVTVICGILLGSMLNSGNGEIQFNPLLTAGETITKNQELNQIGAASSIKPIGCPLETMDLVSNTRSEFNTYFCIVWRAPYMVSTFLFRPILGIDVTSDASLIAAVENIFWLTLFVTTLTLAIRKRTISFIRPILPTLVFFMLYVLGASAHQGNLGTAFRHKSLVLWIVLLVIFAASWRNPNEENEA
jgi:hypothetical protein